MYYNIRLDWNPKVIGVKNGVYQVEFYKRAYDKKTYALIDSFFINNKSNQYPNEIDLKFYFKKLKSAKKTSFMSFSPHLNHCHFLVDKNTIKLLETFNLQNCKFFESVIYGSGTEIEDVSFRLFYTEIQEWEIINFKNTVFTSGGFGNIPKVEHTFTNKDELRNFNGITNVKTLSLAKNFDSSLDLFLTPVGGMFVSEKLKLVLEEENKTGLKFYDDVQIEVSG